MRFLRKVFGILNALDAAVLVVFGTALAAVFVFALPVSLARSAVDAGRPFTAGLLLALPALTVIGVVRDVVARRWSWLSIGLASIWIASTAYIAVQL